MTTDAVSPRRMVLSESVFWLPVNALGIGIYLAFESWILAPRSEENALNGIDEISYWLTLDLPVLIICFILNVIWLIRISRRSNSSKKGQVWTWLLTCLAWIIALLYHGFIIKILWILMMMIDGQAWK